MTALEKLREQLTAKREEQKALIEKSANTPDDFGEEDGKTLDGFTDNVDVLVKRIGQAEAAAKLDEVPSKPEYQHPTDEESEGKIADAGGSAVNYGILGIASNVPLIKTAEYRKAVNHILRAKALGDTPRADALELTSKALTEGTGSAGGFLVFPNFYSDLIKDPPPSLHFFPKARRWPVTGDAVIWPRLNQTATGTPGTDFPAYWQGGLQVSYTDELAAKSETEPAFEQVRCEVWTLAAITEVSKQLMMNPLFDIVGYLGQLYPEGITQRQEWDVVRGSGIGQPLGFLSNPGLNTELRVTAGAVTWADSVHLLFAIPEQDRAGAFYAASTGAMQALLEETGTTGHPIIWRDPTGKMPAMLNGYPLYESFTLPALGATGDLVFVNMAYYYYGIREEIDVQSSAHEKFRYNVTVMRGETIWGGKPAKDAPFVALDAEVVPV